MAGERPGLQRPVNRSHGVGVVRAVLQPHATRVAVRYAISRRCRECLRQAVDGANAAHAAVPGSTAARHRDEGRFHASSRQPWPRRIRPLPTCGRWSSLDQRQPGSYREGSAGPGSIRRGRNRASCDEQEAVRAKSWPPRNFPRHVRAVWTDAPSSPPESKIACGFPILA